MHREHQPYIDQLETFRTEYENKLDALGACVRAEVVEPLCRKFNLEYMAGMGTFCFYGPKPKKGSRRQYGSADDCTTGSKLVKVLPAVIDLLNTEIDRNDVLGFHVADVKYKTRANG
jgi:hypothetical protein